MLLFDRTALLALLLLVSACSDGERYVDAEAFRSAVGQWGVVGLSLDAARAELLKREFACDHARCSRDVPGFPCNQRLRVTMSVGAGQLVDGFEIWTIDGKTAVSNACKNHRELHLPVRAA